MDETITALFWAACPLVMNDSYIWQVINSLLLISFKVLKTDIPNDLEIWLTF